MKKRTVNGKVYTLIPEERKRTCFGCAFFGVFNETHTCPYIQPECKNGMIFKALGTEQTKQETNLKPFNLEKAKAGKPVCTRDGREARIICFDSTLENYPLVVLVRDYPYPYTAEGKVDKDSESNNDLMMLSEKKEGWVNVYRNKKGEYWSEQIIFSAKKDATDFAYDHIQYVTTAKIEWEE